MILSWVLNKCLTCTYFEVVIYVYLEQNYIFVKEAFVPQHAARTHFPPSFYYMYMYE